MPYAIRTAAALWGIAGIAVVLVYAIVRLSGYALEAIAGGLSVFEWSLLVVNVLFMAYAEGYRGFQQRFAPRVAARALHLIAHPTVLRLLLAPLFCAGYFGATARLMRLVWIGTGLIVLLVIGVHQLGQPWRGILDAGVVVGLSWGCIVLLGAGVRSLRTGQQPVPAEVPAGAGL